MDKEPRTKFSGVLIRFHEVIKFQSFEFSVSDVIPVAVTNIPHLVFFAFFLLVLWRKSLLESVIVFLTIFHNL